MTDPYKVLGVNPGDSKDVIKHAYFKKMQQYHSDVKPNDKEAEEKSKEINEAYDQITKKGFKKNPDDELESYQRQAINIINTFDYLNLKLKYTYAISIAKSKSKPEIDEVVFNAKKENENLDLINYKETAISKIKNMKFIDFNKYLKLINEQISKEMIDRILDEACSVNFQLKQLERIKTQKENIIKNLNYISEDDKLLYKADINNCKSSQDIGFIVTAALQQNESARQIIEEKKRGVMHFLMSSDDLDALSKELFSRYIKICHFQDELNGILDYLAIYIKLIKLDHSTANDFINYILLDKTVSSFAKEKLKNYQKQVFGGVKTNTSKKEM